MTTQFTEGKWMAAKSGKNYDITNGTSLIASVKNITEVDKNAKLLAASKTMYLMLKEEIECLNHWIDNIDCIKPVRYMTERKEFIENLLNQIDK